MGGRCCYFVFRIIRDLTKKVTVRLRQEGERQVTLCWTNTPDRIACAKTLGKEHLAGLWYDKEVGMTAGV